MNDSHLRKAVTDAVDLVNSHSGAASVRLEFNSETVPPVDFVANSGSVDGGHFTFTAGFETYGGSVEELKGIRAELIGY